jgi:hypothetical protein
VPFRYSYDAARSSLQHADRGPTSMSFKSYHKTAPDRAVGTIEGLH